MRATIGNMEANVSSDGRSVEFAPPPGAQTSIHLKAFEAPDASRAQKLPESGAATAMLSPTPADHPPMQRVDLLGSTGAALVISAVAIGLVVRRRLRKSDRIVVGSTTLHDGRPDYDEAAERIAFTKRYGGAH